jgi:hypothetical protein
MRLLTLDLAEIQKVVEQISEESKAFKKNLFKIAWFMRGAISLDEIFQVEPEDREILVKIIEENLETTEKSGLPFF